MNKSRFSYLKWTAVVAVLGITIVAGVRPSTATKQPPPVATADLANEERTLAKYFDDFVAYDQQTTQLGAKASFTLVEVDAIQRKSDDLKARLQGLQNIIRDTIRKLKEAKEWENLDKDIAAKITDGSSSTFFKQFSFKEVFEESSNNLASHGNEIGIPLDKLRKKLPSQTSSHYGVGSDLQIVRASYEVPAPMKFWSVRCSIGTARIGLTIKLGGHPSNETVHRVDVACGNATFDPFS